MRMAVRFPAFIFMCAVYALGASADDATTVGVSLLRDIALHPQRFAPATVVSEAEPVLSAEIAGRVTRFEPRVGDIVESGAVIARLDCRDYQFDLRTAKSELDAIDARIELAEQRLERARDLVARESLADEVLDERQSERAVLAADRVSQLTQIERARLAVSRCQIRAPFRALVRERLATVGHYAAIGDPVARVFDINSLELSARVVLDDVASVASSSELRFVVGDSAFSVKLRIAVAAVNTTTRDQELRLDFNGDAPLVGTAGQLAWRDLRTHVPGNILVRRGTEMGLFMLDGNIARFIPIAGAQSGRASAVDLEPDTRIVVKGQFALSNGDPVRVIADP